MLAMAMDTASLAVILIFGTPLALGIAGIWAHVAKAQSTNELKRSMVERGMSAEEIERVLAAKSHRR